MVVIAVIAVVVVLAVVAAFVINRRRTPEVPIAAPEPPTRQTPDPGPPMASLEDALNRVTGTDGRPIGEKIDAASANIDDLRVPDDTGPLLRRALDQVERHDDGSPDESTDMPAADQPPSSDRDTQ